jgi:hypothetical protein
MVSALTGLRMAPCWISIADNMLQFIRKLAVLVVIAGLPMQNLHAVVMPFCAHDQQTKAAVHAHPAQDGAHETSHVGGDIKAQSAAPGEHDHADHQHASADTANACDGCSQCQACSAPALASAAMHAILDIVQAPPFAFAIYPSLFVPEQLQRPPLQFLA